MAENERTARFKLIFSVYKVSWAHKCYKIMK